MGCTFDKKKIAQRNTLLRCHSDNIDKGKKRWGLNQNVRQRKK